MNKDYGTQRVNRKYSIYLKSFIIELAVTAAFVLAFAFVMYLFEAGYKYAAVFATISIAAGTFFASLYAARNIGSKGFMTGTVIGGLTFLLVTLISLIVDDGGLTYNTLFHFIIIMLSALIGGITGVNRRNNRKYI